MKEIDWNFDDEEHNGLVVGDKVICRSNFQDVLMPFKKDIEYIIEKVDTSQVCIGGHWFRVDSDEDCNPYMYWFKECFYKKG